jgi:predicted nuclease with RNAse H fold
MRILSIDLAHTSYANLGIVSIEESERIYVAEPLTARQLGLTGQPSPKELAYRVDEACKQMEISALILDGPQGWKHPDNGLEHCRVCERELNTPGKTGLPIHAKPANYLPFIAFSIEVFHSLTERGFGLLTSSSGGRVVLESFPWAAWRRLGIQPLPSKSKSTVSDLVRAEEDLRRLFPIQFSEGFSHDELQALVAALAGVAFARGNKAGYEVNGVPPISLEGTWREGFIINPTRQALAK